MKWMGYVIYGLYVLSTLWLLLGAAFQLHLLWHAKKTKRRVKKVRPDQLPFVTVQLPVYNEKYVVEDLMIAIANLDYPKHLYEIQVLDDSTDETSGVIDSMAAQLRKNGTEIAVLRRQNREGFKAGALQHGLSFAKGDFIAIFDADFRPPASFLQQLIPCFRSPKVGLVQARWGHANCEQNFLTRIQTYLLDMHFMVEQAGRYNAGYFANFCGTAGIWRKQCIIEAGGWDGSVLSEDLDLSYRAQLKGWTIVYDRDVVVPAQLPAVVEAFKIQQFRWTKGMAQIAKRTLGQLWRAPLPFAKKLHGIVHVTGSLTFICLFVNAVLSVPLLQLRHLYPAFVWLTNITAIGALNLAALGFLYYKSTTENSLKGHRFFLHYPLFIVVYLAMSAQNAMAVFQGLTGMQSAFIRTPKFAGTTSLNAYVNKAVSWLTLLEGGLLAYFVYGICLSFYFGDYFLLLFFGLMACGLSVLLYLSLPSLFPKNKIRFRFLLR